MGAWLSNAKPRAKVTGLRMLQQGIADTIPNDTLPGDTLALDSLRQGLASDTVVVPYEPSKRPAYEPVDRWGDPFSSWQSPSPLLLEVPSEINVDVAIDSADTSLNYTIHETIGEVDYRPTTGMTFEEFSEYQEQKMLKNYWKTRSAGLDGESAVSGRRLIPPIYVSPILDRIFGGSYVDIQPNGFVTLDFGGRWQRIENPAIPVRRQRNGSFEFDQQISMNVVGQVGDKLRITANFDNNTSFDFENDLKVEYTGYEEDIIKKIEIGNVSMPIQNSLMTGAQNLFGVKAQLQFGKLFVTGIASTQRGKSDVLEIESGSQVREFEIRGSEYDENRHFFLGHFFRDHYGIGPGQWLNSLPQITSRMNITRLEVYVINRNNDTETQRNFVAFMDLGEPEVIFNDEAVSPNDINTNANDANTLYDNISALTRDVNQIKDALPQIGLEDGVDYEVVSNARKLSNQEYTFNSELGYLSLSRQLQNDEVLAVAYEYTYEGQRFKVGELTEDYQNRPEDQVIFLKMLRPRRINTNVPAWDLMMKNIYNLNANQITRDNFELRVVYRDDISGLDNPSLHEGVNTKDQPLIRLLGLDRLNQNNDPPEDGNFDFIEGITINSENGFIIFPVVEPFGDQLRRQFSPGEQNLVDKYVYDTLYASTKSDAEQLALKNKFFLKGKFLAGSSNEILLPGINISENSVRVMAGNTPLTEGVDYTVDYNLGKVNIINEGVLNSGQKIRITYEKADLFSFQTRSLVGTRLDYRISDNINIGATLLHLNERPPNSNFRASIGDESISNTKWGLDFNYQKDSRFITKMVDALPLIQTKEPSTITFNGEFAQLIPGTSNKINGEGSSFIDDFESSVTPYNLGGNIQSWRLASTPITEDNRFAPAGSESQNLSYGYQRAKLAWYVIDNVFYRRGGRGKPSNIGEEDIRNHYVRDILPQEIFKGRDRDQINTNLPIFDLAYYPAERGPYNYNPNLNPDGTLPNPEENWGGITKAITSDVDFDKTNIEYIEFWMMDPFIEKYSLNDGSGGQLVFNLGNVSEDVMNNGRHDFENGLPKDQYPGGNVDTTVWGRVTGQQFLTNAFDNSSGARERQDIGLDGIRGQDEAAFFFDNATLSKLDPQARERIMQDASADDFQYFLGAELDEQDVKILERYKNYNNLEGNSPILENNNLDISPSATNLPDNEDINNDNTINDQENYFEYKVSINENNLDMGHKYIVDKVTSTVDGDQVSWYLFRIPVRNPDKAEGNISNYKSIRFIRTYLTGFSQPVVLRMANFQLIGSQWRRFTQSLYKKGLSEPPESANTNFNVSVVNIEENGQGAEGTTPYVLPPGIEREQDNTTQINRRANEQSLKLCVEDLAEKDARAVFKNINIDMINYGRVKMFLHAEDHQNSGVRDDEVSAFLRIGTDFTENYYEIEVPLKITPEGTISREGVWPEENEIDVPLDELYKVKSKRNRLREDADFMLPFSDSLVQTLDNGVKRTYRLTVVGRPELSSIQTIMIGIRNPESPHDESAKSVCIWANELRVSDFDQSNGWAANARLNAKLADFANITASTRYSSFGFGGIQDKINQRSREEVMEYDVAANVTLDKLLPENTGLKIPMYVSYQSSTITPEYDPLDPDVPLEASLAAIDDPEKRAEYEDMVIDETVRRSINFTNVRKIKTREDAKSRIYDIENFSLSYAYSDVTQSNYQTASYEYKSYRGSLAYNYAPPEFFVEPFKNVQFLNSPYLALIQDFNFSPVPSNLSFRADINRTFEKTQLRNADLTITGIAPYFRKSFTFNRFYDLRWDLTKSLSLDYGARANTIIDEPEGDINTDAKRDMILDNIKNLGRMKNFDQSVGLNYALPLDKLPFTDWISAEARYAVGFSWTSGAYDPSLLLNQKDTLGNIIQNNREMTLNSKFDLTRLYDKVTFLYDLDDPQTQNRQNDPNDTTQQTRAGSSFIKGMLKFLTSLKSIDVNYSRREGTLLPGFMPDPFLFGMDSSFNAPGLGFILGSQDRSIRRDAVENGWLARSTFLTTPFSQSQTIDLNVRANLEPFRDFRIQLDARKMKTAGYQEIFRNTAENGEPSFESLNPSRFGSYSISFFTLPTAFKKDDSEDRSPVFEDFDNYREVIFERLNSENRLGGGKYNIKSQDVLIPAFIAAYTGQEPGEISLSPFPKIPIPNWRIDYAGLTRIPGLSDIFSSINITHNYSSTYEVSNYNNSLLYQDDDLLGLNHDVNDYPLASQRNEEGEYVPVYVINQVVIAERFAPLIGVNVRTKSRLNARVEYRKERNLALNLNNVQVSELTSNDLLIDIGYTKANMRLPFRFNGRTITLKNDLTFRMGLTIRDTKTVQRKLSNPNGDEFEDNNVVTSGNVNFQLRPTVNYVMNQRLNIQLYFERNINEPRVSNSFRRATTAFGTKITFSLAQ